MGNWSPYSKEWERQHLQKIIDGAETARIEFEKKPWIYKAIVRLGQTISYYWSLLVIRIRMLFDYEYRQEMQQATKGLEEKVLRAVVDFVNEEQKDNHE
jgi:hypothetical protein